MQDDKLHFVRYFTHSAVATSSDWVSYAKEPTHTHVYHFAPGFLIKQSRMLTNTDDGNVDDIGGSPRSITLHNGDQIPAPLVPLHEERTSLFDAQRYCDAEPSCAGFTLRREPSIDAASDDGAGGGPTSVTWITFAAHAFASGVGVNGITAAYDASHVSYIRGRPLARPSTLRNGTDGAALYTLQLGFLGGQGASPLWQARMTIDAGRSWCSTSAWCTGFTLTSSADTDDPNVRGSDGARWLTFWPGAPRTTFASGWVSYVRADAASMGMYLQQPGFLQADGTHEDGEPQLLYEGSMDVDNARMWCDRQPACRGFSFSASVPPSAVISRTEEENAQAWMRFSSSADMWYTPIVGGGASGGWVSLLKTGYAIHGRAANIGAGMEAPLTWLAHPGFIVAPAASAEDQAAGRAQLLRSDEQAALSDVFEWCSQTYECEGFTTAQPPPQGNVPLDRLQSACYCCRVDVRTSRAQQSWTKWAMPSRPSTGTATLSQDGAQGQAGRPPEESSRKIRKADGDEVPAVLNLALQRLASTTGDLEQLAPENVHLPPSRTQELASASHTLDYSVQLGFLAGGRELHAAFMTLEHGRRWCAMRVQCCGFASRAPHTLDAPSAVLYLTFSSTSEVIQHPEWYAWLKSKDSHPQFPGRSEDNQDDNAAEDTKEEL